LFRSRTLLRTTIRSARLPACSEPTPCSHFRSFAALRVAISTMSREENGSPAARLQACAALSSPSRFLLPLGDQSDPRPMVSPAAFAAATSAVCPYSSRLLSGDQTIDEIGRAHV